MQSAPGRTLTLVNQCWRIERFTSANWKKTIANEHCASLTQRSTFQADSIWFFCAPLESSVLVQRQRVYCFCRPVFLAGSSPGPCSLQPCCTASLTPRWKRPRESGLGWARLMGGGALAPGSWANSWVWPWELQPSYLAQAEGALGFLCKNQSAFPLVVWLPLRRETLPSSVIVPSSSNVAQSASSRA